MQRFHSARLRKLRTWARGEKPHEFIAKGEREAARPLIDLASNDYLGLSRHPALIRAAEMAMTIDGVGAGASMFITGSRPIHKELEDALADWIGQESVLLFPSGFQANLAAVIALADRNTIVIADKLIHHSLLVGVKASGAKLKRFAHNDVNELKRHLTHIRDHHAKKKVVVITESLFSMEGTSPPIEKIGQICAHFEAALLVDEAHALGVIGPQGKGLCHDLTYSPKIISGTFGKAFGSGGAFLASNNKIREELIQASGSFRYTTALAPPLAAAALASLKLMQANPHWSFELQEKATQWRSTLEKEGWPRPPGNGPILSLIIGEDQATLNLQNRLETAGLLCVAIRPPTVPEGSARLRLVLRRGLPDETLERLVNGLKQP